MPRTIYCESTGCDQHFYRKLKGRKPEDIVDMAVEKGWLIHDVPFALTNKYSLVEKVRILCPKCRAKLMKDMLGT